MADRKKKKGGGDEGAPGWIVTFSDLMSLLLTFFVLLLSFSTITEEDFNQAMASLQGAFGVLPRFTSIAAPAPRKPARPTDEAALAARKLRRKLQIEGKEKQVKIEYDATGGLKISLPDAVLFDAGDATLRPQAFPILESVASVLSGLPETFVEVRGHTDGTPLGETTNFRDNYDLSYFRAHSVADRLNIVGGVPMEQFEIVAAGPSQPLATNDTPEGRRANRRVEIYVRGLISPDKLNALEGIGDEGVTVPAPEGLATAPGELDELR
jgi:chemotaxis protein MotB